MINTVSHLRRLSLGLFCLALSAGLLFGLTHGKVVEWFAAPAPKVGRTRPVASPSAQPKFEPTVSPADARSLPAAPAAPVQSGGGYNITQSVIAGGGGESSNGNYGVISTVGQSAASTSSGGQYTIGGGFGGGGGGGGCALITINPATLPVGQSGQPYSQQLTQTGGTGNIMWSVSVGTPPANVTLDAETGLLSGTPATSGNFNFTVTATDAVGCTGTRAYTLTINPPACPAVVVNPVNPTLTAGTLGQPYGLTFTATGGTPGYSFATTPAALPNGLTLSLGGLLSGTPTVSGNFNFTVTATDSGGCTGGRTYALTINLPACPTITVNPNTSVLTAGTVGTAYSQTFTQTGGAGAIVWSSTGALPGGLTLNANSGELSGSPTAAGIFSFTIIATDANNCTGNRQYSLTINPVSNGLQFYPLPSPVRLLETRASFSGCTTPGSPINANGTLTLPARTACAGIPASAAAVTGNITVVPSGAGYLTLFPGSAAQPTVANSNFAAGEITNNVFTVGLGTGDGAFKIFSSATTHVIVDVTGYYAPPGTGGLYFHPLPSPVRLLETRSGFSGCIAPGVPLIGTGNPNTDPNLDMLLQGRSPIVSPCNSIPASAQVLVGNATSVLPTDGGYLTIYPSSGTRPTVASSNYAGSDVINGPFAVKLGADGKFRVYTYATTHLVIDILGYYSEEATDANGTGLLFNPLPTPVRLLETRPDFPGFPLAGCTRTNTPILGNLSAATHTQPARNFCGLPAAAQALVGNVSVVNSAGAGFLTLFPGNLTTAPLVATSNYPSPATFGYNRHYYVALSPADGTFKILTQFTTDLILDASGYFAPQLPQLSWRGSHDISLATCERALQIACRKVFIVKQKEIVRQE